MTPRTNLPAMVQQLIHRLAREWDIDAGRLESEVLAEPDQAEIDRRVELLIEIENRSLHLKDAFEIEDAARAQWAEGTPFNDDESFKTILNRPHTECLLEHLDDSLWTMSEFFGAIHRPGVPIDDSLLSFTTEVFGPPPVGDFVDEDQRRST